VKNADVTGVRISNCKEPIPIPKYMSLKFSPAEVNNKFFKANLAADTSYNFRTSLVDGCEANEMSISWYVAIE
jgi:hypothetical protein